MPTLSGENAFARLPHCKVHFVSGTGTRIAVFAFLIFFRSLETHIQSKGVCVFSKSLEYC